MKMRNLQALIIVAIATCSSIFGQKPPDLDPVLERKPDSFHNLDPNKPARIDTFLTDLFVSADIRGGIVYSRGENINIESTLFKPRGLNVRQILDEFSESTGYMWSENQNVVNITPARSYSILDTRIGQFTVECVSPKDFKAALLSTPEFQRYLKDNGLVARVPDNENLHGYICCGFIGRTEPISVQASNFTIREILNEAVRSRRISSLWTYTEYEVESGGKRYKLFNLGGFLSGYWDQFQ